MPIISMAGQDVKVSGNTLNEVLYNNNIDVSNLQTYVNNEKVDSNIHLLAEDRITFEKASLSSNLNERESLGELNSTSRASSTGSRGNSADTVSIIYGQEKLEVAPGMTRTIEDICKEQDIPVLESMSFTIGGGTIVSMDYIPSPGDLIVISSQVKGNAETDVMFLVGGSHIDQVNIKESMTLEQVIVTGGLIDKYKENNGWKYVFKMNGETISPQDEIVNNGGLKTIICTINVKGN